MSSGHDTGPGGRANRTGCVSIGESHPRGRQLVDVWRFVKSAPIGPDISPTHVVDEEEYEVDGFFLGGKGKVARNKESEKEGKESSSGIHYRGSVISRFQFLPRCSP